MGWRIVSHAASGQMPKALAGAAGICLWTVRKWIGRHQREGLAGLTDRSSRPHRLYRPTPRHASRRVIQTTVSLPTRSSHAGNLWTMRWSSSASSLN
ncbi:MAG: leucine zipper domain-containing protein [Rhizomicrobium sp.]